MTQRMPPADVYQATMFSQGLMSGKVTNSLSGSCSNNAIQVLLNIPLQRAEFSRIGRQVNLTIKVRKKQTLFLTETHDGERAVLRNRYDEPRFAIYVQL